MKDLAIIYWSGTGNTEAMANAIADGAKEAGSSVKLLDVDSATIEDVTSASVLAFGCPSMGDEVLEEMSFEPFIESLEGNDIKKPTLLFGSYDWGDGQWMREWADRMKGYGSLLINDGHIVNNEPGDDDIKELQDLGASLVK
ncbi:flavodoxin [Vallitalea okinawensis]|uniref:flavodoxin n=1 Tax=Vallitalea okinawensis TaxID=2078660 RepID=UPI000CFE131E|nr:flavodoxin [Vallitalea okinawensis]